MRPSVQQTMKELEKYQCPNGGFAYWPGACITASPYLTSYLLHVFKVASDLKYQVDETMVARAIVYLERELAETPPENESWWPAYTAWQAFAVKVLVEHGRNQDSNVNRIYGYRDRMPVFALALSTTRFLRRRKDGRAWTIYGGGSATPSSPKPEAPTSRSWPIRTCSGSGTRTPGHGDRASARSFAPGSIRTDPADGPLDDVGAEARMGQHAGERAGDGSAGRCLYRKR